jgi:menaquinone-dependent protoporphyrinogen oxidase
MKVLVTYASRHGTTHGIADFIGEKLERPGIEVTVLPINQVRVVNGFDAFVIGGATYMLHWMKEATALVLAYRKLLATRPVWLFASGPTGIEPTEAKREATLRAAIPQDFAELVEAIHPRDTTVFYGAYDPDATPIGLAEGVMARVASVIPAVRKGIPAGDFRQWPEIEAWAATIATELERVGTTRELQPA